MFVLIHKEGLRDHLDEKPIWPSMETDPRSRTRAERPTKMATTVAQTSKTHGILCPTFSQRDSLKIWSILVLNYFSKAVPTSAWVPALVFAQFPHFWSLKKTIAQNCPICAKKTLTSFIHSLKGIGKNINFLLCSTRNSISIFKKLGRPIFFSLAMQIGKDKKVAYIWHFRTMSAY